MNICSRQWPTRAVGSSITLANRVRFRLSLHRVEIKTTLPVGVDAQVPGGWKVERTSSSVSIYPGDLYSGQESEFYLKLNIPCEGVQPKITLQVEVSSQGADAPKPVSDELILVYEDDAIVDRAPVVEVAEAANEALKLERQGRKHEAHEMLLGSVNANRAFMPASSAELYRDMSERMAHGMEETDRKQSHNQNYQDRKRFNK
jgi:uncharacterized secreted protein with C-terminal beta-propeller domain